LNYDELGEQARADEAEERDQESRESRSHHQLGYQLRRGQLQKRFQMLL